MATPRLERTVSSCCSRHVSRGCVFWWNNCRRRKKIAVPKPTQIPSGYVVGKTSFHNATRRCKSGSRADRGIFKRPLWPDSSQKRRGSPNFCSQQRRSGNRSSVFSDAVRSGEHGEVIRGTAGVLVEEAANPGAARESRRRRRVSSSDECVSEVENPGPPRSRSRIPSSWERGSGVRLDLRCPRPTHWCRATSQRANHQRRL